MSVTIRLGTISKRRNSTKRPTDLELPDVRSVDLKDTTSYDAPTFLLTGNDLADNYLKWGNRYYFINDVRSVRHNLMEVECILDVLATYKTEILASTQFVSYSASHAGNATWLQDNRIPVINETEVDKNTETLSALFSLTGFYVLSVVGKSGCETFAVTEAQLSTLITHIQDWRVGASNAIIAAIPSNPTGATTEIAAIENLAGYLKAIQAAAVQSDFAGNAYANATQCIRSCIWVPFLSAAFIQGSTKNIFLGEYDTGVSAQTIRTSPQTGYQGIDIPWFHSDWRRAYCESVYLYLPLVGLIQLSADSITNSPSLVIHYSATASDGCVCYEIEAGGEIIGTYAGQASANYPIGINQQASAGEIVQTAAAGIEKMVATGVQSTISPLSMGVAAVGIGMQGISTGYNIMDTAKSTHVSCIGGIGGGAGVGLDLSLMCYTVNHETIVNPADMAATMGRPVMKPMQLSGLSGYCQCANAHVAAPAQAGELDALDGYINSGFYIE